MDLNLTTSEEEVLNQFLKIVNDIRLQHNTSQMSTKTALKFLTARKFDVHRSLALYENHEITRYREGLAQLEPNKDPLKTELETGKFTLLPVHDSIGAAIAMFSAGKHFPNETTHQTTLQGVVYQMDVALEDLETQRSGIVFIYNMIGSKYSNFDYELSQKILSLLKGAYPARLKKVLIVMAPLWFKAPFKILRLFVREKLRDRVFMVNVSQLSAHIPLNALPRELGGHLEVNHKAWLSRCLKAQSTDISELCNLTTSKSFSLNHTSALSDGAIHANNCHQTNNGFSDEDEPSSANSEKCIQLANNSDKNGSFHTNSIQKAKSKPDLIPVPIKDRHLNKVSDEYNDYNSSEREDVLEDENENQGITLEEFIQHLKDTGRKGLHDEYNDIKSRGADGTFDMSRLRANQSKNRYTDVLCFDRTRVKLSIIEDDPNSDYINANYVDGYKQKNAFISTQGPLTKTFYDFWRCVWENSCCVIVMTTKTIERCRAKCGQYWPLDEESCCDFGHFHIHNNGVDQHKDWIITSLVVNDSQTGITREITHMQFTSWPDYGVPHSAVAMLDFRNKVREYQSLATKAMASLWTGHPLGPPIVVHCSAGIGRTGTFITLDISIERLETSGRIDIRRTVEKIRSQRAYSIQMPDQYVFCYLALLEYALCRQLLQDVDLSGFEESESELEE